jgi:hypothetical protein
MVKLIAPLHQVADNPYQVTPDGAANAAVVHLKDFFIGVDDQLVVNPNFTKLVDNDSNLLAMFVGEDAIEESCFPRSQIAGKNRYWN